LINNNISFQLVANYHFILSMATQQPSHGFNHPRLHTDDFFF